MKFVNPELDRADLMKSPYAVVTDEIRKIICDKYGIEGDCEIEQMIDDIYCELHKIVL